MGHMKRTHDLQGNRLPSQKYETTAQKEQNMEEYEKIMANGIAGAGAGQAPSQAEPVDLPESAAKPYVCQKCHGKGVIIDNMLSGSTKPCPECNMLGTTIDDDFDWEGDVDGNVSIDSMIPINDATVRAPIPWELRDSPKPADLQPGGIIHSPAPPPTPDGYLGGGLPSPTQAVKKHLAEGGAADVKTVEDVWRKAREAIQAASGQFGLGEPGKAMTATEVMERKRQAEKKLAHGRNYGMNKFSGNPFDCLILDEKD